MTIETSRQLENTRLKLNELEQLYTTTRQAPATSQHVRELTLRSLRKRINKEEITRFEARTSQGNGSVAVRIKTSSDYAFMREGAGAERHGGPQGHPQPGCSLARVVAVPESPWDSYGT
jgi:hypothetical protein